MALSVSVIRFPMFYVVLMANVIELSMFCVVLMANACVPLVGQFFCCCASAMSVNRRKRI